MLFVLASVHLFVGVIQSRSDYVMSLICRHIFRDHSRASAHKAILKAEKFRRVTAIQLLAEEQMERNSARRAKQTVKLLAFYRRHPAGKFVHVPHFHLLTSAKWADLDLKVPSFLARLDPVPHCLAQVRSGQPLLPNLRSEHHHVSIPLQEFPPLLPVM